ncbi:hypothetical protein IID19_04030 [Patescibacteria group bacterium]|nr:hypothetical protein [Patescibacteria group bacterium]
MEKLKDTTVKVKTKTDTATNTVILISVGIMMAGAIVIGSGFGFAMSRWIESDTKPRPRTEIIGAEPLLIRDVDSAVISYNNVNTGDYNQFSTVSFLGLQSNNPPNHNFGNYGNNQFNDGDFSTTDLPLMLTTNTATHPAMYIALRTLPASGLTLQKSKLGIDTANAQVNIADLQMICLPERSQPLITFESNAPILGIETANAQVNINGITCTDGEINGCNLCVSGTWQWQSSWPGCSTGPEISTYYVDVEGNVYNDASLTDQVDTTNCPAMVSKNFSPNDIYNITPDQPVNISAMVFTKSWNLVLAQYYSDTGFVDNPTGYDIIGSGAPLFVMGANNNEETITQPETILTIQSDLGTKNVCMPQQVLESQDWFVFFVNSNGKPYSDMLLTTPIACGDSNDTCKKKVNCKKFPSHICCVTQAAL